MASPRGTRFSGCVLVAMIMLASASSAYAATGRIAFSGAVVEPTCSTEGVASDAATMATTTDRLAPVHSSCGRTASDLGRTYSHTVVTLDATTVASDRLLGYFASYANVEGGPHAELVVRTYD